jgi:hypothetical protein
MPTQPSQPDLQPILPIIHSMLNKRVYPKTLCPSEVARSLSLDELHALGVHSWRDLMPALRELCFEMRDRGEIEILQKGSVLGGEQGLVETRGPIRIRKKAHVKGEDG